MVFWCKASLNLALFLRWFRMVPESDISHKSSFFQHFWSVPSMVQDGSGWFQCGSGLLRARARSIMHCFLYTLRISASQPQRFFCIGEACPTQFQIRGPHYVHTMFQMFQRERETERQRRRHMCDKLFYGCTQHVCSFTSVNRATNTSFL